MCSSTSPTRFVDPRIRVRLSACRAPRARGPPAGAPRAGALRRRWRSCACWRSWPGRAVAQPARSHQDGAARRAAAAGGPLPARHRPVRPRRGQPGAPRRAHLADGGADRGVDRRGPRRADRPGVRLLRRTARCAVHARDGRAAGLSRHPARAGHRGRALAGADQRDDRGRAGRGADLRAAGAGQRALGARELLYVEAARAIGRPRPLRSSPATSCPTWSRR